MQWTRTRKPCLMRTWVRNNRMCLPTPDKDAVKVSFAIRKLETEKLAFIILELDQRNESLYAHHVFGPAQK